MKILPISALNRRRLELFRQNKRGYWSLWIFLVLYGISIFAPVIANDRPLVVSYKGEWYYPILTDYPETKFLKDGFLPRTDFRMEEIQDSILSNGWILWPPIRYSYWTVNNYPPTPVPSPPAMSLGWEKACAKYTKGVNDKDCTAGNLNWLGTDQGGRDLGAITDFL